MKPNIELRQLRYFVVVAEELNFTRAAQRLQIAQPPISRQIQALEKALKIVLFNRTNRRVTLTPAGQVFLAECRQILQQLEQGVRIAQRAALGETGQLVIGFEGAFHNEAILRIVQVFRRQFSDVELIFQEMSSGKQMDALQMQHIDIGFVDPIISRENISFMQLLSEPMVVVLPESHPLAVQETIALLQLENAPWITGRRDEGCGLLLRFLEICRQAGFVPNIQQETNDIQMRLGFVASGLGITLLPLSALASGYEGVVHREIVREAVKEIDDPTDQVKLAIAWQSDRMSPVLNAFLEVVRSMS
ncbi:MAG: LysR substrate-binding domain-containing protein [Cyanobacteria bacterium J06554_11]